MGRCPRAVATIRLSAGKTSQYMLFPGPGRPKLQQSVGNALSITRIFFHYAIMPPHRSEGPKYESPDRQVRVTDKNIIWSPEGAICPFSAIGSQFSASESSAK